MFLKNASQYWFHSKQIQSKFNTVEVCKRQTTRNSLKTNTYLISDLILETEEILPPKSFQPNQEFIETENKPKI